jgi:glycosyltransferase involved in cell wall biosynthesis
VRGAFEALGWSESIFRARVARAGWIEAALAGLPAPDLVWVSCFRQRELGAACRWARRRGVPVVFDALISAYDKQVFEKKKFPENSSAARKILSWERGVLGLPDVVVVDTVAHAEYFQDVLRVPRERLCVVPVGAEAGLFEAAPMAESAQKEALFYGGFIGLQGPEVIVEAAASCPEVRWTLLGDGPLRGSCERLASGHEHIRFEQPVPYGLLPERIHRADMLLGIFGSSEKSSRVIPNKVYQSMACGRPVVTRDSIAYPHEMRRLSSRDSGVVLVPPGDAASLVEAVRGLVSGAELPSMGDASRRAYERWFSPDAVRVAMERVLDKCVG